MLITLCPRFVAIALTVGLALTTSLTAAEKDAVQARILFCGNSYLGHYKVDTSLAKEVADISAHKSSKLRMDWHSFRKGGSTIAERWNMTAQERAASLTKHGLDDPKRREQRGRLADVIANNKYDIIILQQNSKARNVTQEAKLVVDAARSVGTRTILFMTWRSKNSKENAQDKIQSAYESAQHKLKTGLLPAGMLWQRIRAEKIPIELYLDNGHPSALAHHINALALYRYITGSDLTEIPSMANKYPDKKSASSERAIRLLINEVIVPVGGASKIVLVIP